MKLNKKGLELALLILKVLQTVLTICSLILELLG